MIPLLAPKPFADFSPAEFKTYVTSLYVAPPPPPVKADYSVRLNAKGNPVLTVRREPKWLSPEEVSAAAAEISWNYQALWCHILKAKKIELRVPKRTPREPK